VADLIIGVIGNILGHVAIQVLKCSYVCWIPSIDSAQFLVLGPEVTLNNLGCRQKTQNGDIATAELACRASVSRHQSAGRHRDAGHAEAAQE
jgi:hypothetical protein